MVTIQTIWNRIIHGYQEKIFPVLMDKNLGRKEIVQERSNILSYAEGDILELGIGTGNNLPFYPEKVKKITAIDSYVREIESDRIVVDLQPYACENMKFEDNSFDVVVCTFCLCSVTDVTKTLQEVKRVLKDGGLFLVLEHGKARNRFLQLLQQIANPFFQSLACGCNVNRDYFKQMREQGFILKEESIRQCNMQPSLLAGHLYRAVATVKKEEADNGKINLSNSHV